MFIRFDEPKVVCTTIIEKLPSQFVKEVRRVAMKTDQTAITLKSSQQLGGIQVSWKSLQTWAFLIFARLWNTNATFLEGTR